MIAGASTVAAAVISGVFLLLSKDHSPSATQSTATAPVKFSDSKPNRRHQCALHPHANFGISDAVGHATRRASRDCGRRTQAGRAQPAGDHARVRLPERRRDQSNLRHSARTGVPFVLPPPQQVDSRGSFTFTFTIDSMYCGYSGQINTYDFGGDGQLLTRNPLSVVC